MKNKIKAATILMGLFVSIVSFEVSAQQVSESSLLRLAKSSLRKIESRNAQSNQRVILKAGPNYSGRWAGRLVLASANCKSPLTSFLFRHIVSQSGARVTINTSHDGVFYGQSRDKGRRIEAPKSVTANGGSYSVAIAYKNLSKDGRVSGVGYAVSTGRCTLGFGANGIKQ